MPPTPPELTNDPFTAIWGLVALTLVHTLRGFLGQKQPRCITEADAEAAMTRVLERRDHELDRERQMQRILSRLDEIDRDRGERD